MTKTDSSAPDALPAGTRLMDYDIEGVLGVGGFGIVYRARDAVLQRTVAIKEYMPSAMTSRQGDGTVSLRAPQYQEPFEMGLRSFVNEARLLARFDHPALVRVIRFWEEHGTAYMVMPCYEGQTLYEARRAMNGPPDEAWLRALMEPLLGALDCLHREQVYHRDVAPDNILILQDLDAPSGIRPVLLDFGAARRVISDHTQTLTAILKPSFAPIEQYAETTQLRQGPWTDLYGLAAVLHYCVTGRTPVPATARAVHDDLPSLRQMAPGLAQDFGRPYSDALLATIDRALSVKPDARPASVAAWRDSLLAPPIEAPDLALPGANMPPGMLTQAASPAPRAVWNERTVLMSPPEAQLAQAMPDERATTQAANLDAPTLPAQTDAAQQGAAVSWRVLALIFAVLGAMTLAGLWWAKRGEGVRVAAMQEAAAASASVATARPVLAPVPLAAESSKPSPRASLDDRSNKTLAQEPVDDPRVAQAASSPEKPRKPRPKTNSSANGTTTSSEATGSDTSVSTKKTAQPRNPRQACGGRVFIALAICMKRHCGRAAYTQHPECEKMRRQEEAQRNSQRPYP